MTYVINTHFRSGVRGGIAGFYGLGDVRKSGRGTGTANDPFGGIGGGSEQELRDMVVNQGVTFDSRKGQIQTGLVNREKYVYIQGSDKKFYKWKQTGTGLSNSPSDAVTRQWFHDTLVKANADAAAKNGGTVAIPNVNLPGRPVNPTTVIKSGGGGDILDSVTKSSTLLYIGAAAVAGLLLLGGKKKLRQNPRRRRRYRRRR